MKYLYNNDDEEVFKDAWNFLHKLNGERGNKKLSRSYAN